MDEQQRPVTADEARQVPWIKRDKEQRRAIFEQREANRKANLKNNLDRIDRKHEQRMTNIEERARQQQSAPARSVPDRRLRILRLEEFVAWVDLLPFIFGAVAFVVILLIVLVLIL